MRMWGSHPHELIAWGSKIQLAAYLGRDPPTEQSLGPVIELILILSESMMCETDEEERLRHQKSEGLDLK